MTSLICSDCGWKASKDLVKNFEETQEPMFCELCGAKLGLESEPEPLLTSREFEEDPPLPSKISETSAPSSSERSLNEGLGFLWKIVLMRRAYMLLKSRYYQSDFPLRVTELSRGKEIAYALILRNKLKKEKIPEEWFNECPDLEESFLESFETTKVRLRKRKVYKAEYEGLFRDAIRKVFALIRGKIQPSECREGFMREVVVALKEQAFGKFDITLTKKCFGYYFSIFTARLLYKGMRHLEGELKVEEDNKYELDEASIETLAAPLVDNIAKHKFDKEWIRQIEPKARRWFKREYRSLQKDLVKDNLYRWSLLEYMKDLARAVFNLTRLEYELEKLRPFPQNIVSDLVLADQFAIDNKFPQAFKEGLRLALARYACYKLTEAFGANDSSELYGAVLTKDLEAQIVCSMMDSLVSRTSFLIGFRSNLRGISRLQFNEHYRKLCDKVKRDKIYSLSFHYALQGLVEKVFAIICGEIADDELMIEQRLLANDLTHYSIDLNDIDDSDQANCDAIIEESVIKPHLEQREEKENEGEERISKKNEIKSTIEKIEDREAPERSSSKNENTLKSKDKENNFGLRKKIHGKTLTQTVLSFLNDKTEVIESGEFLPSLQNIIKSSPEVNAFFKSPTSKKELDNLKNTVTMAVRKWLQEHPRLPYKNISELKKHLHGGPELYKLKEEEVEFFEEQNIDWKKWIGRARYDWSWLDSRMAQEYFISVILPLYFIEPKLSRKDLKFLGFKPFFDRINKVLNLDIEKMRILTQNLDLKDLEKKFGSEKLRIKLERSRMHIINLRKNVKQKTFGKFYVNREFKFLFANALDYYIALLNLDPSLKQSIIDFFNDCINPSISVTNIFQSFTKFRGNYYRQPEYLAGACLFIIIKMKRLLNIGRTQYAEQIINLEYTHFEYYLLYLHELLEQNSKLNSKLRDVWGAVRAYLAYEITKTGFNYDNSKLSKLFESIKKPISIYFNNIDTNNFPYGEFLERENPRSSSLQIKGSPLRRGFAKSTINEQYIYDNLIQSLQKDGQIEFKNHEFYYCKKVKEVLLYYKKNNKMSLPNMHGPILKYLLDNNDNEFNTIAIEIPCWIPLMNGKFITGHIDALIVKDNTIYVGDYKLDREEIFRALPQICAYGLMLKDRLSDIDLNLRFQVKCFGFSKDEAWVFDPDILNDYILNFILNTNLDRKNKSLPLLSTLDFEDLYDTLKILIDSISRKGF